MLYEVYICVSVINDNTVVVYPIPFTGNFSSFIEDMTSIFPYSAMKKISKQFNYKLTVIHEFELQKQLINVVCLEGKVFSVSLIIMSQFWKSFISRKIL